VLAFAALGLERPPVVLRDDVQASAAARFAQQPPWSFSPPCQVLAVEGDGRARLGGSTVRS
jgi:hypothetical protein